MDPRIMVALRKGMEGAQMGEGAESPEEMQGELIECPACKAQFSLEEGPPAAEVPQA
jgi:hypothetical protein